MTKLNGWVVWMFTLSIAGTAAGQTFTKIADFGSSTGGRPQLMSLVQGMDGGMYGTASNNDLGPGTVFRLGTDGSLSAVYQFCSQPNCADGTIPYSGVILGTDGNLYGTTYGGGASYYGTVFRLTLSGSLTTLYSFCAEPDCTDGRNPTGGLVQASDGALYGTTGAGGAYDDGTIFKISAAGFETLYSFCAQGFPCPDGATPSAALIQGLDGNFYGSTWNGGTGSCTNSGTLFKFSSSGVFTTLWDFSQCVGGAQPIAPMAELTTGQYYGTTSGFGIGSIFETTSSGDFKELYAFCSRENCSDGREPYSALKLGNDGDAYGTTTAGGDNYVVPYCYSLGCGTIFQASRGTLTTLYSFCAEPSCDDGYNPEGGLLQATNGIFYGTTFAGGADSVGTAFSLDMGLGPFVAFVRYAGKIGGRAQILGQGFTGTTNVSFNGVPATFNVISDTYLTATVPAGTTTGYATVTTPRGVLSSNTPFHVIP